MNDQLDYKGRWMDADIEPPRQSGQVYIITEAHPKIVHEAFYHTDSGHYVLSRGNIVGCSLSSSEKNMDFRVLYWTQIKSPFLNIP